MLVIGGALLGAILGTLSARRQGGGRLDMAQYAAGYAILLALIGAVATILIHRSMV